MNDKYDWIFMVLTVIGIIALGSLLMLSAKASTMHPATLLRVVDGDNVWLRLQVYQNQYVEDNYRLYGLDTPESTWRAKCDDERAMGKTIAANVEGILEDAIELKAVVMDEPDKFGRPLIVLFADDTNVNQKILDSGWAKPYNGKKKTSWCGTEV